MRSRAITVTLLLFAGSVFGADLEMLMPTLAETGREQRQAYVYKTKSREPRTMYSYRGFFMLKNISTSDISVVTRSLSPGMAHAEDDSPATVTLTMHKATYEGCQIVPSTADLALVALRPKEIAQIKFETTSPQPLKSVLIEYRLADHFDGRFGYWTGRVVSEELQVHRKPEEKKDQPNAEPDGEDAAG